MKKFLQAIALLLISFLTLMSSDGWAMGKINDEGYTWRYKVTVEVETPDGVRSGSAVRNIQFTKRPDAKKLMPESPDYKIETTGEAVVVDLGEDKVLFSLLDWTEYMAVLNAFKLKKYKDVAELKIGTKGVLDPSNPPSYPKLVTFEDLDSPTSVDLVQVWEKQNNGSFTLKQDFMQEKFGVGVKLKSITFEITDAPKTQGNVKKYLPWLSDFYDSQLDGQKIETINSKFRVANSLSAGAFSTGENK